MSKNKLVRKVWKLLTPGYGLLTEYIHSVYCPRSLMLLGKVFSRKVYRYFYHYVTIDLFTVTAAILNLLHLRSIMGCPGGHSLSIYARFSGTNRTSLYISREKAIDVFTITAAILNLLH